jgi:hypothetical protein
MYGGTYCKAFRHIITFERFPPFARALLDGYFTHAEKVRLLTQAVVFVSSIIVVAEIEVARTSLGVISQNITTNKLAQKRMRICMTREHTALTNSYTNTAVPVGVAATRYVHFHTTYTYRLRSSEASKNQSPCSAVTAAVASCTILLHT